MVRGEEHQSLNSSLRYAVSRGMRLTYVDGVTYRAKTTDVVIQALREELGGFYLVVMEGAKRTHAVFYRCAARTLGSRRSGVAGSSAGGMIAELGDMTKVVDRADRGDLADLYKALELAVTFDHRERVAEVVIDPTTHVAKVGVRGGFAP